METERLATLKRVAKITDRTPEDMVGEFIDNGLLNLQYREEVERLWHTLTPREQKVAALICLRYTSREIGTKLNISHETVKTHAEHIMSKFGVTNREALRMMLQCWDFREWDQ